MNRYFIAKMFLLFVLLVSCSTVAEVSMGVNLSTSLDRDVHKWEVQQETQYERTTTYELDLYPSLIIVPSGKFEIVPSFGFTLMREKTVDENPAGNERERRSTDLGVGGGCGLFFRLIQSTVFRLSLGPDVFLLYYSPDNDEDEFDVSLGLPVNVDFLLSGRVFLRLGSRLVTMRYLYQDHGTDDRTNHFTFFDIESMLEARLGFFFTF